MKNTIVRVLFLILCTGLYGCEEIGRDIIGVDDEITENDADSQNFTLSTANFNIKVSIDNRVDLSDETILELIDKEAADFLDCQFFEGQDVGLMDFEIDNGNMVPPLSELRIYVVPFNFECDAADKDTCAGIFFDTSDLIIISEESFGRCGNLPLLKHEIAHRYGLNFNHSNQNVFSACSDPEDCDTDEFFDVFF